MIFCCQTYKIKHLYFKDEWLDLKFSRDEPSNIKWQNVTYPTWKRFFRTIVSYFISILLIVCSFAVIIGGKVAQDSISEEYNVNLDCTKLSTSLVSDVVTEYQNKALSNKEKIKTREFTILDNVNPCEDWLNSYVSLIAFNYLTIILVPLINAIIFVVLKFSTDFERNKTLSKDMSSNFIKIFIMQSINSGIVILLVNINSSSVKNNIDWFPILTGSYNDFTPEWFFYVGTTIVLFLFRVSI